MDKYEYKVSSDEIKQLIAQGEYAQAAQIADSIDWRRVKSVMMLCTVSDLYKINRRYEDARDMLLLAYERRPGGRTICYSLCELSIKMEEYVQAIEYYKEFVQVAPKDPGRYILQYKLYEAQDVSLEERIEVLEELKKRDYREKWAYELAYLYHRVGLATRCVEECDELILWFGSGKYVIKAMELKMLHQPLSPEQQECYDHRFDNVYEEQMDAQPEEAGFEQDTEDEQEPIVEEPVTNEEAFVDGDTKIFEVVRPEMLNQPNQPKQEAVEDMDIHVKTVDVGEYNTINLQAELAEGLKEVLAQEVSVPKAEETWEEEVETDVFFGETAEITDIQGSAELEPLAEETTVEDVPAEENTVEDATAEIVMEQMRLDTVESKEDQILVAQPPKELAGVLSQESDGQIRLVMPESDNLEKQITGQMSIEDILAEWERMKKENEEKRKEDVRQHVLEQTGTMFTEFEESMRDGLLEKLESGRINLDEAIDEVESELVESEMEYAETEEAVQEEIESDPVEDILEETDIAEDEVEELEEIDEVNEELETESAEEELEESETEFSEEEIEEEIEFTEDEAEEPEEIESTESEAEEQEEIDEELEEPEAEPVEEEIEEVEEVSEPEIEREPAKLRALTREEKELYAPYIQSKTSKEQLINAVDNISMAAYTGNIIITGVEGTDTLGLAKNMIREVQLTDSNFSGKVAKITGKALNDKSVESTIESFNNGALIIEKVSELKDSAVQALYKCLQQESLGIIVVLVDTKKSMEQFLAKHEQLREAFTSRVDMEVLSNDALVAYGKQYAKQMEYTIDDLGVLALHTRIEELQTIDHAVTTMEVKEIVDEAIDNVNRKSIGHFMDVLFAKRYDEEDMIILTEKDFV